MSFKIICNKFYNIIILYCALSFTRTQSTTPPVITENGAVIGLQTTVDNTTINVFKGIPYAKPPIGDLRFRKTEPAINWNQTYNANNYAPHCMRTLDHEFINVSSLSEDCLYVNVWTPTLNTSANLSVMVWIYGGELIDNKPINYDMSYLAQKNVVVVSLNYRLDIFGYLYGNSSEAPGNAGLWDQVMALNWTHSNIANFGGNPNDITLFGELSGSNYVSDLIVSNNTYGTRDWFNKAILLSGKTKVRQETQRSENAYNLARIFARNSFIDEQCYDDNEWIKCLRDKPVSDLLVSGIMDVTVYGDYYSLMPYSPNTAAIRGYFRHDLQLLINRNEFESDSMPKCETVMFGSYIAKWQSFPGRVYQTKYTYRSGNLGFSIIPHSNRNQLADRVYHFGQRSGFRTEFNSNDKLMSNKMMDLFTHFAKTGETLLLNHIEYGDWPPYSVSDGYVNVSYIELNPDPTRLGRVYTDRYSLNADNRNSPNDNSICLDYSVEDSSKTFRYEFHNEPPTTPVITDNGVFIGLKTTVKGAKVNAFQGIPFSKRPNFARRQFKKKFYVNGAHMANIYRPDCTQPGVTHLGEEREISEDCLYVNVWTPTLNTSANLSVMVWIYSWDNDNYMMLIATTMLEMLTSSEFFPHINYDDRNLVERNVVVVTLYYAHNANGNGFSDNAMVLNWTRRNIANFGGNPNDITLFGERAGSMSVNGLIISNHAYGQSTTPPVITKNGAVIGLKKVLNHSTINVFKGIPYGRPPIGHLRFRKTEPAINWSEILVTTKYAPHCMQRGNEDLFSQIMHNSELKISEDCLYLNVWTPTLNTSANLSVMVWINGGVMLSSSPETENYDMSYLAQRNVVVVSFNYRLGVFGFLYGNSSEAPGNAGLWDQVMALNWTHNNIANFGGNPNDITLFGSSAGSISVSQLIVSNASLGIRNWFNKAILLSGSAFVDLATHNSENAYLFARDYARNAFIDEACNGQNPWLNRIKEINDRLKRKNDSDYLQNMLSSSLTRYEEYAHRFEKNCAKNAINDTCKDDNTWIDCLRKKSASDLLIAQIKYLGINLLPGTLQFQPIFGDVFSLLPYSPNSAVKQGYFRQDLRILMNHNEMEGDYFTRFNSILDNKYSFNYQNTESINKSIASDVLNVLFKNYAFKQQVINSFIEPFSSSEINSQLIRPAVVYAFGDFIITCPTVLFGAYISKWQSFTGRVYQTRFTYQSSTLSEKIWSNTTHLEEIIFLFIQQFIANWEYNSIIGEYTGKQYNSNDKLIGNKMMDLVTHFAKTGEVVLLNPSVYNTWPPYSVIDGYVNVSYVELNPDPTRLGRVYTDRYRGNDGYTPKDIYNCFNFWDKYFK